MIELRGLHHHQVVQRTIGGTTGKIAVDGTSEHALRIAVRDTDGNLAVPWEHAGSGGPWKAELAVPVGGPYDLVAEEGGAGSVLVHDFLVGDLWLLAGQSNMQGLGRLTDPLEEPSPLVHVLDLTRTWGPAADPLHRLFESPDPAHHLIADPAERAAAAEADRRSGLGAGLGVAFGKAMVEHTDVPVGLVVTAQGGTSLDQWSPSLRDEGGASLYGSLLLSAEAAGGRFAGVLWYQGESDALGPEADAFAAKLRRFVQWLRWDLATPALPFFHVQLGRIIPAAVPPEAMLDGFEDGWNTVREAQRTTNLGPGGMTTAVDLGLSDFIHISTASLRRLGRRLARLASGNVPTMRVTKVEVTSATPGLHEIRVDFDGVTGRLQPAEHIAGFEIRGAGGERRPVVYETVVPTDEPSTVVLRCVGDGPVAGDALWYGYGVDPYVNLVDEADMAAPAFGPWSLTD